jgi:hypothetical protein
MKKREQILIDATDTSFIKYRRLSKEAHKFAKLYGTFIRETSQYETAEDFILALRTHLFMSRFKMKNINKYINEVVIPKINEEINKNVKTFSREQKEVEKI